MATCSRLNQGSRALLALFFPRCWVASCFELIGSATSGVAVFAVGLVLASHPIRFSPTVLVGTLARVTDERVFLVGLFEQIAGDLRLRLRRIRRDSLILLRLHPFPAGSLPEVPLGELPGPRDPRHPRWFGLKVVRERQGQRL